jgi:hypothetical protein
MTNAGVTCSIRQSQQDVSSVTAFRDVVASGLDKEGAGLLIIGCYHGYNA